MSFASDLLDGFEALYKRTDGVIKSCTETADFYKSLAKCEKEYARALSKLASSQKQEFKKAPPVQKEVGSTFEAWDVILTELEKISEHHSQFADKLENDLSKTIMAYIKEKQKVQKKLHTDGKRVTQDMRTALDNLSKARSKYVQLSKEADSCEAVHTKGKGDMSMKPSALAKLAAKAAQAADRAAAADNDYQHTLNLTNQKQHEYYTTTMPELLKEFQQFEEDRIQNMKEITEKFASLYKDFPSSYSASAEVISSAASSVNVQQDIKAYINENKTNVSPPPDIAYTPYDTEAPGVPKAKPNKPKAPGKIGNYNPSGGSDILGKEWGLSASDQASSLDAKQSKLSSQLEQLEKAILTETKAKDGLENLVRFYASDPVAQKKAEDQIAESEEKIQKLRETKAMVQSQLDSLGGGGGGGSPAPPRSSGAIRAKGLYDYTATCDTELTFKQGDILTITEQDDSGWWYAELNGSAGFVPNNYVEQI